MPICPTQNVTEIANLPLRPKSPVAISSRLVISSATAFEASFPVKFWMLTDMQSQFTQCLKTNDAVVGSIELMTDVNSEGIEVERVST